MTMDQNILENLILSKLNMFLPRSCEVIVSHPTQFISVDIVSEKYIHLPPDAMTFLVSLHIVEMSFLFHHVGNLHHVSFKVLG